MPKTKRGKQIMSEFQKEYGSKRGKSVAYATAQKKGGRLFQEIHGRKKGSRKKK
jgi:hypothetical protein